ncbi:MAG: hypothetical protein Q7U10_02315 [Thermodesulfovibrionia bacterium]|nr:hypothetical protein [Thermodesulfovibrionia bacterium]
MTSNYLFRLLHLMFLGFALSAVYCGVTAFAVWQQDASQLPKYLSAYIVSFNCLISGGIVLGAGIFVLATQKEIPSLIEEAFSADSIAASDYPKKRKGYASKFGAAAFSANYIIVAFFIFYFCKFPVEGIGEYFLIAMACVQYAFGVYVGRKIYFIAHMLHAVADITPAKNVLRETNLSIVVTYVNIVTTITIIGLYINVVGFYRGPFLYTPPIGSALKIALLLPVLIAVPVLIVFNFYPRIVLRKLYAKSITEEVASLTKKLGRKKMSEIERMSFLIEYDRLAKEEAKGKLQLSLSDLPMGITIVIMLVGLLSKL